MEFSTNKQKGNCGLAMAISYFVKQGYVVSIPLNDTQDYDLVVDFEGDLSKIQCKATSQKTDYNITRVGLRSMGGTRGKVYKVVKDTNIDFMFVVNEEEEMWLIPKVEIAQTSQVNLKPDSKFRLK